MLELILNDPVAWGSLLGLGVVLAICFYYVYLFIRNSLDGKPH
ncbi:hypothetical protein GCM10009092_05130 [Bowmanella denitrificans]|uniref:DUF3149 domain-containing protein n=1 Tax=Bowmanella denitrificans TaxID=366582 RepID=A0ABN0WPI6_9ALTE